MITNKAYFCALCVAAAFFSAYSTPAASETATEICRADSVTTSCMLQSGESEFLELADDQQWIDAASEFAVALNAAGQREVARTYLDRAAAKARSLDSAVAQISAAIAIGEAAALTKNLDIAIDLMVFGENQAVLAEVSSKRNELLAKLASLHAAVGNSGAALVKALALPQTEEDHAAFKARALREIAAYQATAQDFEAAEQTLAKISMGLTYYQSTARSDVASLAFRAGQTERGLRLLSEAETIARNQENGYFGAGALRDIAIAYIDGGFPEKAKKRFQEAKAAARNGDSNQEKARALSRVATGLTDRGLYSETDDYFAEALEFADQAQSPAYQDFAKYEIAGSAAFAGNFEMAYQLVETLPDTKFGSTSSLKAATQRDIAWGLAKHGRIQDAGNLIRSIAPARERIMALSRIVRLLINPKMEAFPRYL